MVALVTNPFSAYASHLIGGNFSYRYLGANKYEIKLIVYRDCSVTTDFDNPAYISIYNKTTNALVYNKGWALLKRDTLNATPPNPCFVPPKGICVEEGVYLDTVFLPTNSLGYTVSHQNCCRNNSVLNILNPSFYGTTITTDIPPQINNTPKLITLPPIFICFSDTLKYSFASTDADGDSLVYQLCTPLSMIGSGNPASPPPYPFITWSSTFTATNPIPSSGGLILNSLTGKLKFKPSMVGQFEIALCVLEYRNHVLINTNRLELQFNVVNCYLVSSIPTATNLCKGLTIPFQNSSTNANAYHWDFGVPFIQSDTSNQFAPTYTYPTYGTYTVSLIVYNTAYGFCKDSSKKIININPLLSPTLQPTYSSCFKNNIVNFNVGGTFHPSATFNWNFTANSISPNINVNPTSANFTTPSPKTVSVVVNQFGCKDTLHAVVSFSNPIASFNDNGELNCNGLTLNFNSGYSSNASFFKWDFGDPTTTTDTSTLIYPYPSYTYPSYGTYTVTLIASDGNCTDTLKLPIIVQPTLSLNWTWNVLTQCFKNNSFNFFANGIYGAGANFNWIFTGANPSVSNQENPQNIHFLTPGIYKTVFSLSQYGCTKSRFQMVKVLPDPKTKIFLSDSIGCAPITIKFKSIADSLHPIQNYWNINNTAFTDTTINYTFNSSGLYSYNLIVKDTNNCTDTISKINYIQINPKPKIKSFVNPFYASILDPSINFIDSTVLNHYTNYSFGDGATSTQTNITHSYQSTGEFNYSLIVITEHGCADTAKGIIYIDDINSNYVPNIFTPNGDGVNDRFFIKGKNITSSKMQIINRWGATVCNSSDAMTGWNGINQNNNAIADDGVYLYIIEITLGNNRTYKFNGNVTLLK